MAFSKRFIIKFFAVVIAIGITFNIFLFINLSNEHFLIENDKISWEDLKFIKYELTRKGPGERGEPYYLTNSEDILKNEAWYAKEGFSVIVSDQISVTRSLPDYRPVVCQNKTYFRNLPKVSVIVTFHNEIWSTLTRCLHSIYNRSPLNLLHEIVLINDKSTFPELYGPLRFYVKEHFDGKVLLIENEARIGLIQARMKGSRVASGEVIIFLDSHMEVANTWLPPLLEPLVQYPHIATVPIIEVMDAMTMAYMTIGYGYRGGWDWNFRYQFLPLRPQDTVISGEPFELICMTGGAYAIRRDNFFRLGGYDEGLRIWNGENFELSFKLWLCSNDKRGGLLGVPCSRVMHLSKSFTAHRYDSENINFSAHNLKRVAEVWLDEYKEYFYRNEPELYAKLDIGDLTEQFKLKERLKCKPFKYYLYGVAPDMLQYYPPIPVYLASGNIRPKANLSLCLSLPDGKFRIRLALVDCTENVTTLNSNFLLTSEKSIKYDDVSGDDDISDQCLTTDNLAVTNCHHQLGDQYWRFNINTRFIENSPTAKCLAADIANRTITLRTCDINDINQKWEWSKENQTALETLDD